jgi:heme oxygenase
LKFPTESIASPVAPAANALAELRLATRERHARIDRLMDLRRMREAGHYGRVLLAFDSFLGPWEQSVASALPARCHGWLQQRSRRPFLREDLAALSLSPRAAAIGAVPRLAGDAAAWGSLYVIEGSALGGQVITRALAPAGLVPTRGAAYFHGWGAATHAMWEEFLLQLQAELATPAAIEAACAAACDTFDALTAHLHELLNERAALA